MQKSAGQLNALCRLKSFLNTNQKKIIVYSFIYSNYNYCPLVSHFCSKKFMNKMKESSTEHYSFFIMITIPIIILC